MARATWFCIDIECSGPVPALYDMLSLGVTVVAHGPDGVPAVLPEGLYVEIRPTAPRVDPGAMRVNRLDLAHPTVETVQNAAYAITAVVIAFWMWRCELAGAGLRS